MVGAERGKSRPSLGRFLLLLLLHVGGRAGGRDFTVILQYYFKLPFATTCSLLYRNKSKRSASGHSLDLRRLLSYHTTGI